MDWVLVVRMRTSASRDTLTPPGPLIHALPGSCYACHVTCRSHSGRIPVPSRHLAAGPPLRSHRQLERTVRRQSRHRRYCYRCRRRCCCCYRCCCCCCRRRRCCSARLSAAHRPRLQSAHPHPPSHLPHLMRHRAAKSGWSLGALRRWRARLRTAAVHASEESASGPRGRE